jgi:hypothetical protein
MSERFLVIYQSILNIMKNYLTFDLFLLQDICLKQKFHPNPFLM